MHQETRHDQSFMKLLVACNCNITGKTDCAQCTAVLNKGRNTTDTAQSVQSLGYRLDILGFYSWQRHEIFLFSKTSKPTSRSSQPPIQWVLETLSLVLKWPEPQLTTHRHLAPRLRVSRATPPPSLPSQLV